MLWYLCFSRVDCTLLCLWQRALVLFKCVRECVVVMVCPHPLPQSMAVLRAHAPADFTEFCAAHFAHVSGQVLELCQTVLAGGSNELTAVLPAPKCSAGFLLVLAKVVAALSSSG